MDSTPITMVAKRAMPPMTRPMIAPVFRPLSLAAGVGVGFPVLEIGSPPELSIPVASLLGVGFGFAVVVALAVPGSESNSISRHSKKEPLCTYWSA